MIKGLHGIPGSGKNVIATHIALKHYKKENFIIRRFIRKLLHQPSYINNVYSTYPILLKHYPKFKKKSDIYSNRVSLFDLIPSNRFLKNALIIIDETQVFFDSEEHKDFPKPIATFNQFHRHFGIKDIIYITQHPSRLMKKLRILCCQFDKVNTFLKLPFIPIGFCHIISYFEFEDYGKYHHPKKEIKSYEVKNSYKLFIVSKVFKAYDSTYMSVLNSSSPLYYKGSFKTKDMSKNEIKYIYRDKI